MNWLIAQTRWPRYDVLVKAMRITYPSDVQASPRAEAHPHRTNLKLPAIIASVAFVILASGLWYFFSASKDQTTIQVVSSAVPAVGISNGTSGAGDAGSISDIGLNNESMVSTTSTSVGSSGAVSGSSTGFVIPAPEILGAPAVPLKQNQTGSAGVTQPPSGSSAPIGGTGQTGSAQPPSGGTTGAPVGSGASSGPATGESSGVTSGDGSVSEPPASGDGSQQGESGTLPAGGMSDPGGSGSTSGTGSTGSTGTGGSDSSPQPDPADFICTNEDGEAILLQHTDSCG